MQATRTRAMEVSLEKLLGKAMTPLGNGIPKEVESPHEVEGGTAQSKWIT